MGDGVQAVRTTASKGKVFQSKSRTFRLIFGRSCSTRPSWYSRRAEVRRARSVAFHLRAHIFEKFIEIGGDKCAGFGQSGFESVNSLSKSGEVGCSGMICATSSALKLRMCTGIPRHSKVLLSLCEVSLAIV